MARPSKTRETGKSGVEETFVKRCKGRVLKYLCYKFKTPANKGAPDRIVLKGIESAREYLGYLGFDEDAADLVARGVLEEAIEFVELKAPGKKPEPHQVRFHDTLRRYGFKVTIIDNKEDAKRYGQ